MLCPVCASSVTTGFGDTSSSILIVVSYPNEYDIKGRRLLSKYRNKWGDVTLSPQQEFFERCELDLNAVRVAPLWYHAPSKDKQCLDVSSGMLLEEMEGKTKIILYGDEAIEHFTGLDSVTANGMDVSEFVDDDSRTYFAMRSFSRATLPTGYGEFEFSMKNLKEWLLK